MEFNRDNIEKIVEYINLELKKNPELSVNKICNKIGLKQSTFKTWVHKAGYSFDFDSKEYKKDAQVDKQAQDEPVLQNNNIDMDKLNELINLLEPLKKLVKENRKKKSNNVELNPPNVEKLKQKLFKVDVDVLEDWDKFVMDHKQYKVQNLISLALKEFIDKYK